MSQDFIEVALISDLSPGRTKLVRHGKELILLANVAGQYLAVEGKCSHASVALSRGALVGEELTCPLHKSVFNIRTGEVVAPPASRALKVFPVAVKGKSLLVGLPR
jgi:3-phenylpropionate/trans-cinnamate dioxygenase ferredoxin subunit